MTVLSKNLQAEIRQAAAILRAAGARDVYLLGSFATATADDASDIDLAVSGMPPERFFRAMGAASNAVSRSLDLIDLDEDSPFARYLKTENKLVRAE